MKQDLVGSITGGVNPPKEEVAKLRKLADSRGYNLRYQSGVFSLFKRSSPAHWQKLPLAYGAICQDMTAEWLKMQPEELA